ncbi:MAG: tRNA guanosine(34) transglycosylase Tgt [Candidatus Dadabacteria bacterium]|nr:MAG: tRNA guanosine(34) transglycosylase Tgt [Candidatus Dadabacteria bacterium]
MGRFRIIHSCGEARCGVYSTGHGEFETPNFMPVGTRGSVKGLDIERVKETGAQIILVNTYHLWLRPGQQTVRKLGDIHGFTAWDGPILSDSGGYQVFSLKGIRKLTREGVEFQSHIDGARCFLTPELSVEIQETLGVDIAMVLDECPASDLSFADTEKSLNLTLDWARRSYVARRNPDMSLFGITQGGLYPELRKRSAEELAEIGFDGFGIGGLSVGEPIEKMYEVLSYHVSELPKAKIRYLMGVGTPRDIVEAVKNGVDLFDCVIPTRAGRFGRAYISGPEPYLNIKNACFAESLEPLDSECNCLCCRHYSRGYLRHLFQVGEMLGPQMLSLHNITFYQDFMRKIRDSISRNEFNDFYAAEIKRWENID